jgi:hypothetical protein
MRFMVSDIGFRVYDMGCRVYDMGRRVYDMGCIWFRIRDSGFRIPGGRYEYRIED